jgi:SAM-dependent methyltransferase
MLDPRAVLADPRLYALTQRAFGAVRARRLFVSRFVRPQAGERILDIGCGTGDILDFLPDVDYVGVDLSADYIRAATERYGHRGRFLVADVIAADLSGEDPFDVVLSTGVVHHLDDSRAERLFGMSAALLKDDGRLLSWDGAFVDGQPRVARWLLERDRGEHVRTPDRYVALASASFAEVEPHLVTDFLHVPYTHCVLDARRPRRSA